MKKKLILGFLWFVVIYIICYLTIELTLYFLMLKQKSLLNDLMLNWKIITFSLFISILLFNSLLIFKFYSNKKLLFLKQNKLANSKLENVKSLNQFSAKQKLMNNNGGFALNFEINKTNKNLLHFNLLEQHHMLVIGTSGIGKSQSLVIPNIIINLFSKDQPNLFISDPKGELYNSVKDYIKKTNYQCIQLDFINFNQSKWNPFNKLSILWHANQLDDYEILLDNLAEILITEIKSNKDPIWHHATLLLIKTHLTYLLICDKSIIVTPKILISTFSIELSKLIKKYKFVNLNIIESTSKIAIYKRYVSTFLDDKNKMIPSIYLMTLTTLQKLASEKFFLMSNEHDVIIDSKTTPTILFMKIDPLNSVYWSLASMFIFSSITELIKLNSNKKNLFILDEFANLPTINNFSNIISISRGYKIFFMLVIQSYNQLENKYQQAENIMANINYNLFLHTNDMNTAKLFSNKLGNKEMYKIDNIYNSNKKNLNYQKIVQPVINEYDLTTLSTNIAILKAAHYHPIKIELLPFYMFFSKLEEFIK